MSLRIVDAVLRFRKARIEFSVVPDTNPDTSKGQSSQSEAEYLVELRIDVLGYFNSSWSSMRQPGIEGRL
jgi:hypothetical protein